MTRPVYSELGRSGTLDATPYAHLLVAIAEANASVVLEVQRSRIEKTIIFDKGTPADCRSNIATELLSRFLIASGRIAESDVNAAFAVAASRGVPLGEVLTERKLLTPTELFRALQQNLGRKLLEPFGWPEGTWSISEDVPLVGSVLRVKAPQLVMTGIQKLVPQERADEAAAFGKYLAIAPRPPVALSELRLTETQQKVVDAARRARRFDDLIGEIQADELNRAVYALSLLGIIDTTFQPRPEPISFELDNPFARPIAEDAPVEVPLETIEADERIEPRVDARPADGPARPQPVPALVPDRDAAEAVFSAFLSFRRKDAFEMLEVEETADARAIVSAYMTLAQRFLPSHFPATSQDGLREKAQEVFLAAARAYAELADPTRRQDLVKRRSHLKTAAQTAISTTSPAAAPAMVDPEALFRNGVSLAAAGKLREALSSFELAAECDVQNGTYAAEAAWCRYRLAITPAASALKLLKNALRIDPQCGVAYLYIGQVQAALGKRVEAEAYLQRAVQLLPRDPRPAEALKALR